MSHVLCMLTLLVTSAGPQAEPAAAQQQDKDAALRQRVVAALLEHRLDGFEGTVTFEKEFWYPPKDNPTTPGEETGYSRQRWEITTDGRTAIVAKLDMLEGSNATYPFIAGEDPKRIWKTLGRELHVYEKDAFEQARETDPVGFGSAQQLTRQAWGELRKIFAVGGFIAPGVGVEDQIVSISQTGETVNVVAKRGEDTHRLAMEVVAGSLLPVSVESQNALGPSKWTFSGYYRAADRWIPHAVQWEGPTSTGESDLVRMSGIGVSRISDRHSLAEALKVPSRAKGPYEDLVISRVVTAEGTIHRSILP